MPTEDSSVVKTHRYGQRYALIDVGYDQDPPDVIPGTLQYNEDRHRAYTVYPMWRQRVKKGMDATTNFVASSSSYQISGADSNVVLGYYDPHSGELLRKQYNIEQSCVPGFPAPQYPTGVAVVKAEGSALSKFIQSLTNAQRSFQGLVFAGELLETLHMIRNPAQALWNEMFRHHARVKKRTRGLTPSKRGALAAELWVENSFGWQPLVNDIKGGAEALAKLNNYRPEYQVCSGFSEESVMLHCEPISGGAGGLFTRVGTYTVIERAKVKYLGMIAVERGDQIAHANMRLLGVSWQDVIPAAWELIPNSFLVDYFANVGGILDALAIRWDDVRWKLKTTVETVESRYSWESGKVVDIPTHPLFRLDWLDTTVGSASVTNVTKVVTRAPLEGALIPTLNLRLPFSFGKFINLAALARLRS